jgi:hypothetical protein
MNIRLHYGGWGLILLREQKGLLRFPIILPPPSSKDPFPKAASSASLMSHDNLLSLASIFHNSLSLITSITFISNFILIGVLVIENAVPTLRLNNAEYR